MSKLSPVLELGLLDQLGIVDGREFLRTSTGDPAQPDNVAPSGVATTTKDTGAPGGFLGRLQTADPTTQILTGGAVLLGILGLVAIARAVF